MLSMLPDEVRMKDPVQTHEEEKPFTQQVDKEGQTSKAELSSEKICCESCEFYYGERQSESHVEEAITGTPCTPPHEEKDEVLMLQGMFERILRDYKKINREAAVTLDTIIDELHEMGARKYLQTIHAQHEEDYQARCGLTTRER